MPPAVTRELSVTYAGLTIGGTSDYEIDGKISLQKDYNRGSFSCSVIVRSTTESGFASACAALEAAWRTPRRDLVIALGGQTLISWSHANNTGFTSVPSIDKAGDEVDTARTRRYTVAVEVVLPADLTGQDGLRNAAIAVSTDIAGIRTLTISGEYTAMPDLGTGDPARSAWAQYNHAVEDYCAAVRTALGGYWELVRQDPQYDDPNKILGFSREYRELVYPQGANTTADAPDDPDLIGTVISVVEQVGHPGEAIITMAQKAQRMTLLTISVDTYISKDATESISAKWTGNIRPWALAHAEVYGGLQTVALIEEQVHYEPVTRHLTASLQVMGPTKSMLISASLRITVSETSGLEWAPAWSGNTLAHYEFATIVTKRRHIVREARFVRTFAGASLGDNKLPNKPAAGDGAAQGGGNVFADDPVDIAVTQQANAYAQMEFAGTDMAPRVRVPREGWRPVQVQRTIDVRTVGAAPYQFDVVDEIVDLEEIYIKAPTPSTTFEIGAGPAGGGVSPANRPRTGG